ncbi:MAG: Hpt domain-containing protein [Gammaproteobacteria bacterium]|nr:Hpt domain-containing protein [Gammaproteobacteria bacterium]
MLLARELQESQENVNVQLDMMLGLMHLDPLQLASFLDTAETGLKLVNSILREPARIDGEFRKKLAGLFREMHAIKGEASALNLKSIASRVHALEDMVSECKKKPELTGSDFLPMVLKLDDLLAHLRSVREMAARLSAIKDAIPPAAKATRRVGTAGSATGVASGSPGTAASPGGQPDRPARGVTDLSPTLQSMAERLSHDHAKRFNLSVNGLGEVPAPYVATIKDCLIQMLRNAAVHGIETPEVRAANAKQAAGTVRVDFRKSAGGYELIFEDDGAGISTDELKSAAVRGQLISAEEAAVMENRAAMALIFRPGFTTQPDVSMDAGRGVGMDVVARSVYALGGKIGVTTHPGRFTRFRITLPAAEPAGGSSTAVA